MTTEFMRFYQLLQQFLSGELDAVNWGGTEPNLSISIQKGHAYCVLDISFYLENGREDAVIAFHENVTKDDIKLLLNFCEENIKKYPVRRAVQL